MTQIEIYITQDRDGKYQVTLSFVDADDKLHREYNAFNWRSEIYAWIEQVAKEDESHIK